MQDFVHQPYDGVKNPESLGLKVWRSNAREVSTSTYLCICAKLVVLKFRGIGLPEKH